MYVELITSYGYGDGIFQTFLAIANHTYDHLHMVWIVEPTFGVEYAGFWFLLHIYMVHKKDPLTSYLSHVSRLDWLNAI
jgi:hypothetical protein